MNNYAKHVRVGSVYFVESLEGTLGPDNESSEVTTGGEVKEVHPVDVQEGNSGQITEGFGDTVVFGVDDQGSLAHGVSSVSDLADTSPDLNRDDV